MNPNSYQKEALRTVGPVSHGGHIYTALGLAGEVGEYVELVKHKEYHSWTIDRDLIREELGDIAWYLAVACDSWHMTLEEVLQANIDKLQQRYPAGYSHEESMTGKGGHRGTAHTDV